MTPQIVVSPDIDCMAQTAERLLIERSSSIYQRGGQLVRVIWHDGEPSIRPVPQSQVLAKLCKHVKFVRRAGKDKNGEPQFEDVKPPRDVVQVLAERGFWDFRLLRGVTEVPLLRDDGSILQTKGYDSATKMYYAPAPGFRVDIPDTPSRDDARRALAVLWEPFADFRFGSSVYHSAALAALLTALLRPSIDGPVPAFAIEAATQGTGKTLLASLIGLIATGRMPAPTPQPRDENEDAKRIAALMASGARFILVDNVTRRFGSGTMGALLTAPFWHERLLGGNECGPWPNLATWILTGNNLSYCDDMVRRVIPIYLDAQMEKPQLRSDFKHTDILAWAKTERSAIVSAALTLIRAYTVAGRPKAAISGYGAFEGWSSLVRQCLVWLDLDDPLDAQQRVEEEGDVRVGTVGGLLVAWHAQHGSVPITLRELADKPSEELLEALTSLAPAKGRNDNFDQGGIGYILRQYKDRPIKGLRLKRDSKTRFGVAYRVEKFTGAQVIPFPAQTS